MSAPKPSPPPSPIWYRAPMLAVRVALAAAILWLSFACIRGALHVFDGPAPRVAEDPVAAPKHPAGDLLADLAGGGWVFADSPWHLQTATLSAEAAKIRMDEMAKAAGEARCLDFGAGKLLLRSGADGAPVALEYVGPAPGDKAAWLHATAVALGAERVRAQTVLPTVAGGARVAVRLAADGRPIAELVRVPNVESAFAAFRAAGWTLAAANEPSAAGESAWTAVHGSAQWRLLAWPHDGATVLFVVEDPATSAEPKGKP